jgi:hypothetical protein
VFAICLALGASAAAVTGLVPLAVSGLPLTVKAATL